MATINIEKQRTLQDKMSGLEHNFWHLVAKLVVAYYSIPLIRPSELAKDFQAMERALAMDYVLNRLNRQNNSICDSRHGHNHVIFGLSREEFNDMQNLVRGF